MEKLKNKYIKLNPLNRLYQIPVPIIGLTGGIASGKSTVSKTLQEKYPVIDADQLVKNVYSKQEVIDFIKTNFNQAIIENKIDFKILRKIAFNHQDNISKIENVIYKHLPDEFLNAFSKFNNPAFIIYDVPLLFEKKLDDKVDLKICVYSPKDIQIARLIKRDHIDYDAAQKILGHQLDIEAKKKLSDFVIENISDLAKLKNNIHSLLNEILE